MQLAIVVHAEAENVVYTSPFRHLANTPEGWPIMAVTTSDLADLDSTVGAAWHLVK